MKLNVIDRSEQFVGLSLALTAAEIDALCERLAELKLNANQHFHLSNQPAIGQTYVDLEVSVQLPNEKSNASETGFTIEPDDVD